MGLGVSWRKFSEKARQQWHITTERDFEQTPNTRNELMLNEAGDFAGHLKKCEKDIHSLKVATEGLLNTVKIVMSAPLPRVYEDLGQGKAQPVAAGAGPSGITIGGEFKVDDLTRVGKETAKKLEAEVLAPMQRWTNAYNTVVARMKRLEGVRLEVDSRRRTVTDLARKIERQRAKLPTTRAKGEFEMEQTIKKMQHKENKLAAARQSFKEQEALVFQQLAQLIRDAVWLKSYIAAVMRLEQEAFQAAFSALGPTKASLQLTMVGDLPISDNANMIGAARPSEGQAGFMQSLTNKNLAARQAASGKDMGHPAAAKENVGGHNAFLDLPPAPTHRVPAPAGVRYGQSDRYADQNSYGQTAPAWYGAGVPAS